MRVHSAASRPPGQGTSAAPLGGGGGGLRGGGQLSVAGPARRAGGKHTLGLQERGEGVVVTAGNILTTEIRLHDFAMLNLMCTVGHDCEIGRFVTVSPGVNISGNVGAGGGL